MIIETSYSAARATLASLCDQVASSREPVFIRRRGAESVALISASELAGLLETAHLLRSSKNAQRLLRALRRAQRQGGKSQTVAQLRRQVGLAKRG
jgi:antitoxin YefM